MGLPSVVTTDQGTEFRNTLNSEMMSTFGIKHRFTTAYHPQVTVRLYIYRHFKVTIHLIIIHALRRMAWTSDTTKHSLVLWPSLLRGAGTVGMSSFLKLCMLTTRLTKNHLNAHLLSQSTSMLNRATISTRS